MTTYTAPVMPAGSAGHSVNAYAGGLNLPIDQRDLRHFDQGLPLLGRYRTFVYCITQNSKRFITSADEMSSSAQLLFNQKCSSTSRRCKDPAMLSKKGKFCMLIIS